MSGRCGDLRPVSQRSTPSPVSVRITRRQLLATIAAAAWLTAAAAVCPAVSRASGPLDPLVVDALRAKAYLFVNGQPRFDVVNVVQADTGWYVGHIKLRDVETETGTVILRQDAPPNGAMTLVAGPGTAFPAGRFPPAVENLILVYH